MRKKKNSPSLLDQLEDLGYTNVERGGGVSDLDRDDYEETSSSDVDKLIEENEPDVVDTTPEDEEDPMDDKSEIPDDVQKRMNNEPPTTTGESLGEEEKVEDVQPDPNEAQNIGAFFDAFAEALNWDVEDDEKPTTVEGLIDYIGDVVEQNSTPTYADERIAQLDNYVKNGGKFEDFYQAAQQELTYDNMDMEDESNQKAVVRDYMKLQGFDDEQINRRIERFEDADMLMEEAEDAVDRLKKIQETRIAQAAEQQARIKAAQEEQARQFMTDLNSSIGSLDNIRGIAVPKEDRKRLLDYITRTDADGLTQYQKDFNANMINNLIESAYFTMKGDSLLGEAKRNGQTSAASKLRNMLRHQTKNHSTYNANEENKHQLLDVASKFF